MNTKITLRMDEMPIKKAKSTSKQPIARQKIMREEYDLKKLKVKRRGLLREL